MKPTPFIILSGPSGVGKTTLTQKLLNQLPSLARVITTTTRMPRTGEAHGIDYFFVSAQAFSELERSCSFLETNTFGSAQYGTPRSVLHALSRGVPLIALPDINGARHLKSHIPHAVCIWLEAPLEIIAQRLAGRGTESALQQAERLKRARVEMTEARSSGIYTHVIDMTDGVAGYAQLIALMITLFPQAEAALRQDQ